MIILSSDFLNIIINVRDHYTTKRLGNMKDFRLATLNVELPDCNTERGTSRWQHKTLGYFWIRHVHTVRINQINQNYNNNIIIIIINVIIIISSNVVVFLS